MKTKEIIRLRKDLRRAQLEERLCLFLESRLPRDKYVELRDELLYSERKKKKCPPREPVGGWVMD